MPTVLLCHCDGTNGSTTFTDVSPSAHTFTVLSGTTVTTSQVKFGTGSINVNSGGIYTLTNLSDFNFLSAPFTIEAWAYATTTTGTSSIVAQFDNTTTGGWYFGSIAGALIAFWYWDGSNVQQRVNSTTTVPVGSWHFYTVDRDAGGMLRVYLDGAVVASASAPTFTSTPVRTNIGNSTLTSLFWPGYIDEVRITKGTALYGGAFTPPTGPFANGGAAATAQALVLA